MTKCFRHISALWIAALAVMISNVAVAQSPDVQIDSLITQIEAEAVSDTINIGYESSNPSAIAGAISRVSTDLTSISRLSPLENLQGRVAGAYVVTANGQPGGEISMLIRGVRSLAAGSEPLYVVDGFPLYSDNYRSSSQVALGPRTDIMSMFNPEDIAAVTVLKDTDAKAIYGARGANGVVIIETKQGVANRPGIDLSISAGIQRVLGEYDLLDGATFAQYINESRLNAGQSALYTDPSAFGEGTDWQEEIRRSSAAVQDYNLRFTGGSANTQYMVSGSFTKADGIYRNNELQRFNLHANIKSRARSNLLITNSLNLSRTDIATSSTDVSPLSVSPGLTGAALMFNPILGVDDPAGDLTVFNHQVSDSGEPTELLQTDFPLISPVAQSEYTQSELNNTRFTNYLSLDWEIIDHLTLRIAGGVDALFNEEAIFASSALNSNGGLGGFGSAAKLQNINWVNEYNLKYSRSLREVDQLDALVGFSIQGFDSELLQGDSRGFENESLGFYNLGVGQTKAINSYLNEWQLVSFYGRVRYSLNNRFHFGITGRADGSSNFSGDYEFFPAASFGWNVIHPQLDSPEGALNALTLRVSGGWAGTSEISPYSTLSVLSQFETNLNGVRIAGFRPVTLGNDDLEMERTREFNFGLSLGFMDNRLGIDIDFYQQQTNNALVYLPQSGTAGIDVALVNGAETSGSGIELSLRGIVSDGSVKWTTGLDLAYMSNEVRAVDRSLSFTTGTPIRGVEDWSLIREGARIGSFYGYETDGIVQTGDDISKIPAFPGEMLQPGDRKYRDIDNNGVIDENDKTIIGESLPDVVIGFNNTLRFAGLDLNFYFQGALGQQVANFNKLDIESLNGQSNITQEAYENRWTADNASNTYPLAVSEPNDRIFSDAIVENGSYFRLRSLSLGYSFKGSWMESATMERFRVYVQATNLFTITSYSGVDPDVSHFGRSPLEGGVDLDSYPKAKQIMFGLQISF